MASPAHVNTSSIVPYVNQYIVNSEYLENHLIGGKNGYVSWSDNESALCIEQTVFTESKKYLKYLQKFLKDYELNKGSMPNHSAEEIKNKVEYSLSALLSINPDALSLEITNEATLFYTLKKGNFSFYIDQYLEDYLEDGLTEEEFVITTFNKKIMLNTKSASITSILENISDYTCNN